MATTMRRVRSSRRPKVLCLGVSYADVTEPPPGSSTTTTNKAAATTAASSRSSRRLSSNTTANTTTVQAAIASVQSGRLTQMDGRDLVRCRSTEDVCGVDVYTVSQEKGCAYRPDRHLEANFNRHDFVRNLRQHFGRDCRFAQVILDYFWIPAGWDATHWSRSFFSHTLTELAAQGLLQERTGVIYLPFCLHCFKQVQVCFAALRLYYNISFVRKGELENVALWKGTQAVDAATMQRVLGKHLSQEETYCTFGPRDVGQAEEDANVSKQELIQLARTLEDFGDIRFIRLDQLPKSSRPNRPFWGTFLGCQDPARVKRGFDQMMPASSPRSGTRAAEPRCKRNLFAATTTIPPPTSSPRRAALSSPRTPSSKTNKKRTKRHSVTHTPSTKSPKKKKKKTSTTPLPVPVTPSSSTSSSLGHTTRKTSPRRSNRSSTPPRGGSTTTTTVLETPVTTTATTKATTAATITPTTHGYPTRRSLRRSTSLGASATRRNSEVTLVSSPRSSNNGSTASMPVATATAVVSPSSSSSAAPTAPAAPATVVMIDHRYPTRSRSPCTVASLALLDATMTIPKSLRTTGNSSSKDGRGKKPPATAAALFS